MPEVLTDAERQLAKKVADLAMVSGWDNAIGVYMREYGIAETAMRALLKKAADYNDEADPSGRIEELEDYKKELQGRSTLATSGRINRPRAKAPEGLSPKSGPSRESAESS